jgi:hexosaminidase
LKGLVEPVSWNYFTEFDGRYQSSSAWNIYPKFFNNMWAASAFKGGLHRFSMITNTKHHVQNNLQWLRFMQSSIFSKDSFSAIILTGWSRFDHFMPICDLLPTAYPALLYSLHVLNTNQLIDNDQVYACDHLLRSIEKDPKLCELLPGNFFIVRFRKQVMFVGAAIWSSILKLSNTLPKIHKHLKLLHTIAPEYNRKYLFVRRVDLHQYLSGLNTMGKELLRIKDSLNRHLTELYSTDVVIEWFDLYLTPIEVQINVTMTDFLPALEKSTWPRRPFNE